MPFSIPKTQLGVLCSKTGCRLETLPVGHPGPGEVMIRNVAVASNPKDWLVPILVGDDYNYVEGNDIAGTIVEVGEGVTEYRGGECVAAFTKTRTKDNKCGAYTQYSVAPATTTFPKPDNVSYEEIATLPLAVMTAALGLFVRLGLPEPPAGAEVASNTLNPSGKPVAVIVNGASSSVGAFAVQLAKRAGLFVVGVAGASCDYAKEMGADAVIDYREHKSDTRMELALIAALNGVPCAHVFDAVCSNGSSVMLAKVLAKTSEDGRGKLTYVLSLTDDEQRQIPAGISTERTSAGTAHADDEKFASRFLRQISAYLADTKTPFKPNRVRVLPDGLASVERGLQMLRNNEVHAEKLVYRISETPGLKMN